MTRKRLKQWLVTANGWQRIWFVGSIVCFLYFLIIYPLSETNKGSQVRYQMRWAAESEMKNAICAPYMTDEFDKLAEPEYSKDGSTCYHIYSHRKYSENNGPITERIYQQRFESHERSVWLTHIGIGAIFSTFLVVFIYGFGAVVSWIIKGFSKGTER